jgi:hypothetical protein
MIDVVLPVELEAPVISTSEPAFFHLCITHDNIGLAALFDWLSIWDLICHI